MDQRFNHIAATVLVSDIKKSIEWYTKVLDFELVPQITAHFAFLKSPEHKFMITLQQSCHGTSKPGRKGSCNISFGTDDVQREIRNLSKHGVKITGIWEVDCAKLVYFTDLDGNELSFHQWTF